MDGFIEYECSRTVVRGGFISARLAATAEAQNQEDLGMSLGQNPADQKLLDQHADHEQYRHRDGRHDRIDADWLAKEADIIDHHEFAGAEVRS
jgi:hypothetical protein